MKTVVILFFFSIPTMLSASCFSETPPELRKLLSDIYISQRTRGASPNELTRKLSKLTGMIIKESSANTCSVTDMSGNGSGKSYMSFFKHNNSKGILSRSHKVDLKLCNDLFAMDGVRITKQTNYGLAQISADRWDMDKRGGLKLEAFMKRIGQLDGEEIIKECHSSTLYSDSMNALSQEADKWKKCQAGSSKAEQIKCLGKWLTLCPSLNIEIALEQPMSYFDTKAASPLCEEIFKKAEVEFINKKLKEVSGSEKSLLPPKKDCCL